MSKITEKVAALAKPVVEEEGCTLWDVEYVREAGTWYLRVFVDKEGGLSIEDCERISRRLDPMLDELTAAMDGIHLGEVTPDIHDKLDGYLVGKKVIPLVNQYNSNLYGLLYLNKVVSRKEWDDFYGFNRDGKWPLSFAAMLIGTALLCLLLSVL